MIERAVILSTGDELTSGLTVDTNSNFIADKLFGLGIDLVAVLTVGDQPDRIAWAFTEGLDQADLVLSTGGLGPTADDLTTETLAAVLGRRVILDGEVAERIRQMFRAIGREMPENNLRQACFPQGAEVIPNPLGTAPGFRMDVAWKGQLRHVVVMPGVPREMKPMMEDQVLPWVRSFDESGRVYRSHVFQTFGASESALDAVLKNVVTPEEARLSFRAAFPQISVRVTVRGRPGEIDGRLAALAERVREKIGSFVFGEGGATMEGVVLEELRRRGWKLALAESCTGGLVAQRITSVAGSSEAFVASYVTYSPEAKIATLGVRRETIDGHGIVSEETAREMAEGARRTSGADVGVAVTGVAGPGGATAEHPVGAVVIALSAADTLASRRYQLWGTRDWIRLLASQIALDWVRRQALGLPPGESLLIRK